LISVLTNIKTFTNNQYLSPTKCVSLQIANVIPYTKCVYDFNILVYTEPIFRQTQEKKNINNTDQSIQ